MHPEETELNCDSGSLGPCRVWLGPDLSPQPCGGLRWEAGRLTDILPAPASLAARDLQWGVLPAFVNGHTHIGDCFLAEAAIPLTLEEAFFRPDGLKYRELERIAAAEHIAVMAEFQRGMAAAGCVAHLDFREQGVEGARRLRAASEVSGVRSVILSQVDRIAFDAAALAENTAPIPSAMRAELAEILTVADGISESTMNDWTEPAWRELRTLAAGRNKATAIHCLESSTYRSVSLDRCGIGDLRRAVTELQPDVVVHLTVAEPEEIALLAAAGIPAVLNPRANSVLGLPLPPVAALLRAGVPLLLGTDNGILNGPDLFRELDFTCRLLRSQSAGERPPHPVEVLKMVTRNLQFTRWGGEFPGEIDAGLPANLLVVDLSRPAFRHSQDLTASLVLRAGPADVAATLRAGKSLHKGVSNAA